MQTSFEIYQEVTILITMGQTIQKLYLFGTAIKEIMQNKTCAYSFYAKAH